MKSRFFRAIFAACFSFFAASEARTCVASPYTSTTPGCVDLTSATADLINLSTGYNEKWLTDIVRPITDIIKTQAKTASWAAGLGMSMCLSEFKGSDILNAPKAGTNSQLKAGTCDSLPLNPNSMYSVVAVSIPSLLLQVPCEGLTSKEVSMCVATSSCDGFPTFAFSFDSGVFECLTGNGILTAATGGISKLISAIGAKGLKDANFGLSTTADLGADLKVWDGNQIVTVRAPANIAAGLSFGFDTSKLGLPPVLGVSGSGQLLLSLIGDAGNFGGAMGGLVQQFESSVDIEGLFNTLIADVSQSLSPLVPHRRRLRTRAMASTSSLYRGLSAGFQGSAKIAFKLSDLTKGAFPNIGLAPVKGDILLSLAGKANSGVDEGLYLYLTGANFISAAVTSIVKTILPLLSGVIDELFGDGATEKLFNSLLPDNSGSTELAFTANAALTGVHFKIPIQPGITRVPPFSLIPGASSAGGLLEVDCKFQYSGDKFSCSVKYIKSTFVTGVMKAGMWVIKEGKTIFDESGRVILAVANDVATAFKDCDPTARTFTKTCGLFQPKFIQDTGNFIKKTEQDAQKGIQTAVDKIASWGQDVVSWSSKGETWCGIGQPVTDAVVCGSEYVTSAELCGMKTITDAATCGTSYVANCLKDLLKLKVTGCKKAPNSCQVVGSCWTAITCSPPKVC